ncbi:hypothetical protein LCGC14_0640550 [marine sediment metagenome]|uniref:Uncharacterized protein n=1 Tax=marine sediment metagenome TaxID=412755 RepID=A0A0F9U7M1_9ZZZZ|nr:hypothetical protein [bacterium]
MVKCQDCKSEMVYRPQENDDIILVCPNPDCDFQSQFIKLDQSHTLVDQVEDIATKEIDEISDVEDKSDLNVIVNQSDREIEPEKLVQEMDVVSESYGSQTLLTRTGKLDEFIIYCVDFSTRMDIEIPIEDRLPKEWKNKIANDRILSDVLKNELIELINPPISFFNAILFTLSIFLLENIKKMTFEDFNSFQVISLAGNSDEIFRFPSFIEDTTPDIIIDFIKIVNITRQEYRVNDDLTYRNFSLAIQNISDLITELRESYPHEKVQIYLLTIGNNKTKENKYINPIREIKEKLEDLMPFSFNIINFNGIGLEKFFGQITRRFSGQYSRENTFKGLINSILYNQYGTDPYQELSRIQDLKSETPIKKEPEKINKVLKPKSTEKIEILSEIKDVDIGIQENDIGLKDIDIKINERDIKEINETLPDINLRRKADNNLDQLIEELR